MSTGIAQSVAKNTTVMMASQVITWASSFVLMLVLPRFLGSEEYGRLYLAISLTLMFQMLMDFGGSYFIAKEVARARDRVVSLVGNSIAMRLVLWVVSLVLMLLFCVVVQYSDKVIALIAILGFAKVWEVSTKVLSSSFQGLEMMEYTSFGNVSERVSVALMCVIALLLGADAVIVATLMAFSTLLNFSVVVHFAKRVFLFGKVDIQWAKVRVLVKDGFPYFLYSLFAVIYYRVDAVMLSLMTTDAVVGWYGAAHRFFDVLMFLPSILTLAVFPVLARLKGNNEQTLSQVTCKSLDMVILTGIPISILCCAFSQEIIGMFFGFPEFEQSVLLLQLFSIGLLLVYIDFVLGTALFATDRQRQWTAVAFFALLLNPALNYMLIPVAQSILGNGGIGAAIATLMTELFVMVSALMIMPSAVLNGASVQKQLRCAGAGVVMVAAVLFIGTMNLPWIVHGALSILVYVSCIAAFRAIDPSEMEFLQKFFTRENVKKIFIPRKEVNV